MKVEQLHVSTTPQPKQTDKIWVQLSAAVIIYHHFFFNLQYWNGIFTEQMQVLNLSCENTILAANKDLLENNMGTYITQVKPGNVNVLHVVCCSGM